MTIPVDDYDFSSISYRDRAYEGGVFYRRGSGGILGKLTFDDEEALLQVLLRKHPVNQFTDTIKVTEAKQQEYVTTVKKPRGRRAKAPGNISKLLNSHKINTPVPLTEIVAAPVLEKVTPAGLRIAIDLHGVLSSWPRQIEAIAAWARSSGCCVFTHGIRSQTLTPEMEIMQRRKLEAYGLGDYPLYLFLTGNGNDAARKTARYCHEEKIDMFFGTSAEVSWSIREIAPQTLCLRVS